MRCAPLITFGLLAAVAAHGDSPRFIPLPYLQGDCQVSNHAFAVSPDGRHVVGSSCAQSGWSAVRWQVEETITITNIGDFSGAAVAATAYSLSHDGAVVVGQGRDSEGTPAFRWTDGSGLIPLPRIPGASPAGSATDCSGDGDLIVGVNWVSGGMRAVRWTAPDVVESLDGGAPLTQSQAYACSESGDVIVGIGWHDGPDQKAFRWTESSGFQLIPLLPGYIGNEALGVSEGGDVIVGKCVDDQASGRAFRWRVGSIAADDLGNVPGNPVGGAAVACSRNGDRIVGQGLAVDYSAEATIWQPATGVVPLKRWLEDEYRLDLAGWRLSFANDISPNGLYITGYGESPSNTMQAFLVRLPCLGDVIPDMTVDLADLAVLLSNFGT